MITIRADHQVYSAHGWSLYGFEVMNDRATHTVQKLTMEESEDGMVAEPFVGLTHEAVQQLMDDLWIGGMRPSKRLLEEQPADFMRDQVKWDRGMIEILVKKLK